MKYLEFKTESAWKFGITKQFQLYRAKVNMRYIK